MTAPSPNEGDGATVGSLRLNWWVWYAAEAWAEDDMVDFLDGLNRAFEELKNESKLT